MERKFTVPGPPKGKQRPRVCRINGRSLTYTPKQTIEYERLVRARYVAALAKSRSSQSGVYKSGFTRKGLAVNGSTQCLDNLISRNGGGSYPLERNLPVEISILALYPVPKYASKKTKNLMLNGCLLPTKKPDSDNTIKIILDALNGVAYCDDSQVCRVYFEKMYAKIPETKIIVKEINL